MPHLVRSALVSYPVEQMFALVNDCESYGEFLPWCSAVTVHERSPRLVVAELLITRGGMSHRVTTRNLLSPPERITIELVKGPFEQFVGEWRFTPLTEAACKVELEVDFQYTGPILGVALTPLLARLASKLIDAFHARARSLYGG